MWTESPLSEQFLPLLGLPILCVLFVILKSLFDGSKDELPVVNRKFALEPSVFARFRWMFRSEKILDAAYNKYDDQCYRIARGDVEMVVLPSRFISELNKLPQTMINSRLCHAYSMTGHLNGMNIVLKTNLHVRVLHNRITSALPDLLKPVSARIGETIKSIFTQNTDSWNTVEPMDLVVYSVSRGVSLANVGAPLCDDPDFIRLICEHTKNVFTVMFAMRLVPAFLQPFIVWLLPYKWRLRRSLKGLEQIVSPRLKQRKLEKTQPEPTDLLSWMIKDARNEQEADPQVLAELLAALAAGGIYSSANLIVSTLLDLTANPHFLEEIREEISAKQTEVNGNWDYAAFNSLHKLDSALKETVRLTPGSLTTYSRVMLDDHTLSNGLTLKKGQFICVSSFCRSKDPRVYDNPETYDALRAYNHDLQDHLARPFRNVYDDLRWGAGRWACAGRYLATLVVKVILVKLIDEFDFQFPDGPSRPPNSVLHEFIFIDPSTKLMMRRRKSDSGIVY